MFDDLKSQREEKAKSEAVFRARIEQTFVQLNPMVSKVLQELSRALGYSGPGYKVVDFPGDRWELFFQGYRSTSTGSLQVERRVYQTICLKYDQASDNFYLALPEQDGESEIKSGLTEKELVAALKEHYSR